jgi:hypothetical protein
VFATDKAGQTERLDPIMVEVARADDVFVQLFCVSSYDSDFEMDAASDWWGCKSDSDIR